MPQQYEREIGRHIAGGGPVYPNITVRLSGTDGNAFAIIGAVKRAMQRQGASKEDVAAFQSEAMSGDYDNLLRTCLKWVEVR